MADILNYKCPNCSAPLIFNSKTQKMTCDFCGSSYTLEELQEIYPDQQHADTDTVESSTVPQSADAEEGHETEEMDASHWQTMDMTGMKALSCPSCGAEVIVEESVGAVKCPYCDNAMIVPKEFSGMDQPEYVIP
ncbi:MAG: hypothetical protein IJW67_02530, partial [Blautia sp.]|nr:hypothetical protein [Blautia sp.]